MNRERTEATMNDREALAAALELLYEPNPDEQGRNTTPVRYPLDVIGTAARERLAQLPETCPTCDGFGFDDPGHVCPTCHGSGKVYPAELRSKIAATLRETHGEPVSWAHWEAMAVAVLDALNGETE